MRTKSASAASLRSPIAPRGAAAGPTDHRRSLRVPLSSAVDLRSRDNFFAGRARDISLGGLFLETTAAINVGAVIGVRLQILDRAFAVTTEVTWTLADRVGRPLGLGVRFVYLPTPMVQAIAAFMRLRAPIGFDVEETQ